MANECYFEMHAKGNPEQLKELVRDMRWVNDDGSVRERHMGRIYSVKPYEKVECADGTELWKLEGDCAWSAMTCMTAYAKDFLDGDCDWFVGIEDEANERGLQIEVHDSEPTMGFATRIVALPDAKLSLEEFDCEEVYYEEGFDDMGKLRERWNLTDREVAELEAEGSIVRTDMDASWQVDEDSPLKVTNRR